MCNSKKYKWPLEQNSHQFLDYIFRVKIEIAIGDGLRKSIKHRTFRKTKTYNTIDFFLPLTDWYIKYLYYYLRSKFLESSSHVKS